jgi:hypothetical protein
MAGVGPADVHNRDPRDIPLLAEGATVFGNGVLAESADGQVVFCQLVPWHFAGSPQINHRKTFRRTAYLVSRLLAGLGAAADTPVVERFSTPVADAQGEQRWQSGLYLDQPEEWDYPYRFFRW